MITASRYMNIGLLSTIILMPAIFNPILRIISFNEKIRYFSEALLLSRNILDSTINEFTLGILTAPKYHKGRIFERFWGKTKTPFLMAITLVARIPFFSSDILASTYVRQFCICQTKVLDSMSLRARIAIITGIVYFTTILVFWCL